MTLVLLLFLKCRMWSLVLPCDAVWAGQKVVGVRTSVSWWEETFESVSQICCSFCPEQRQKLLVCVNIFILILQRRRKKRFLAAKQHPFVSFQCLTVRSGSLLTFISECSSSCSSAAIVYAETVMLVVIKKTLWRLTACGSSSTLRSIGSSVGGTHM